MLFTIATTTQQTITLALFIAAACIMFLAHQDEAGWAFVGMAGGAGTIARDKQGALQAAVTAVAAKKDEAAQ